MQRNNHVLRFCICSTILRDVAKENKVMDRQHSSQEHRQQRQLVNIYQKTISAADIRSTLSIVNTFSLHLYCAEAW